VGDNWAFVWAPGIVSQKAPFPPLTGVMRYLAWLQAKGFEMPPATSGQQSVLESLKEWADEELHALNLAVFQRASRFIWTPDMAGLARRLMWLLIWMDFSGAATRVSKEFYTEFLNSGTVPAIPRARNTLVVVDDGAQKVYVNLGTLRRASQKLPKPDLDGAIRDLAANKNTNGFESGADGFIIDKGYWDAEEKRWHMLRL
jgi:hypothetical protein